MSEPTTTSSDDEQHPVITDVGPFAIVPKWVWEQVSGNALKVYVILRDAAGNGNGVGYPSRMKIATAMKYTRAASVDPFIAELVAIGAITVHPTYNKGQQTTNRYMVRTADPQVVDAVRQSVPPLRNGVRKNVPLGGVKTVPLGGVKTVDELDLSELDLSELDLSARSRPTTTKPKTRKAPARPLPASFKPNDGHRTYGKEHDLDVPSQHGRFVDYHQAKGTMFVDWDAAFRMWLKKAAEYEAEKAAKVVQQTPKVKTLREFT